MSLLHTFSFFFFFNDTATTEIYTLSLHERSSDLTGKATITVLPNCLLRVDVDPSRMRQIGEHTSELQSQSNLVCRLLLEKKKKKTKTIYTCFHEMTCSVSRSSLCMSLSSGARMLA